ncbi:MAG: hypothetical protein HZB67_06265 [Candidatus Aenigmarchaeota archaeon]|nr:hypothetical protein [Candidatus Aenigmarchaeota archaeon]
MSDDKTLIYDARSGISAEIRENMGSVIVYIPYANIFGIKASRVEKNRTIHKGLRLVSEVYMP